MKLEVIFRPPCIIAAAQRIHFMHEDRTLFTRFMEIAESLIIRKYLTLSQTTFKPVKQLNQ